MCVYECVFLCLCVYLRMFVYGFAYSVQHTLDALYNYNNLFVCELCVVSEEYITRSTVVSRWVCKGQWGAR